MSAKLSVYRRYSEVNVSSIDWLWYPLIPKGKITLVQGDPGEGKSLMILDIISSLSTGRPLPGQQNSDNPINIIYQCSEDGIEDTIKPRLIDAGADCSRVAFVSEEKDTLSISDERLRATIEDFHASLIVIDPIQSYMGDNNMFRASEVRRISSILEQWALKYNCSFILMGHLTKSESAKTIYRGIGSIDFMASARSVLQVDHLPDNPDIRRIKQIKSNLSKKADALFYTITNAGKVEWLDSSLYSNSLSLQESQEEEKHQTKQETTVSFLRFLLSGGPSPAIEVRDFFLRRGIGQRTLETSKKDAGIRSYRKDGQWFWELPNNGWRS